MGGGEVTTQAHNDAVTAEASAISAVMLDNRAMARIGSMLDGVQFADRRIGAVWDAMRTLDRHRQPIDTVTLSEAMKGHDLFAGPDDLMGFLVHLDQVAATSENIEARAEIIRGAHQRRGMVEALKTSLATVQAASVFEWQTDAAGIPGRLMSALEGAARSRTTFREALRIQTQFVADAFEGKVLGLRTGYRDIDRRMRGLRGGELAVFCARPGVGKSALAYNISTRVALGVDGQSPGRVAIVSGELPHHQVAARHILAAGQRISTDSIRSGKMSEGEIDAYHRAIRRLNDAPINIITDRDIRLTMENIASELMRIEVVDGPLSLVIIDQAPHIKAPGQSSDRFEGMRSAAYGSKELAMRLDVPVIVLNQVNRAVDDRPEQVPKKRDIWGSDEFEQAADWLGLLWRARVVDSEAPPIFRIDFAKSREGEPGVVELVDRVEYGCLNDVDYRGGGAR